MEDNKCVAITSKGTRCTHKRRVDERCNDHHRMLTYHGPTYIDRQEHDYKFRALRSNIARKYTELINAANDRAEKHHIKHEWNREITDLEILKEEDLEQLERRRQERGNQPDIEAQRLQVRLAREQAERNRHMFNRLGDAFRIRPDEDQVEEVQHNQLHNIARDIQSVHTTVVVNNVVKKAVEKLLKIEVPKDYAWNSNSVSKTVVEIMAKCNLSVKAAKDLCSKYLSDDDIYGFGFGIYGRTLDGVWQFIINKQDNEDMIKVLKQELEDNVGMCSQGQLTRICNVLAGYIEDIGVGESINEVLGREFAKLMEIDSVTERLSQGVDILEKYHVDTTKWQDWLKPLEA